MASGNLHAQSHPGVPHASASADSVQWATVDANTRWAFRTISPVRVSSSIVRLRDIVVPLDPQMGGWQRLGRASVGLVPLDGTAMVIDRERLGDVIRKAEATPSVIEWVGPEQIKVIHDPNAPKQNEIRQTSHRPAYRQIPEARLPASTPPLPRSQAKAILARIQLALKTQHESVVEAYAIDIDLKQPELVHLHGMIGPADIDFLSAIGEGRQTIQVLGNTQDRTCQAVLEATLTAHPRVVFPRKTFSRGHRLRSEDLVVKPVSDGEFEPSFVSDPNELVGMEVHGMVRANQPISRGEVGAPVVIKRGDAVDIQVIGGGITVTTRGRAVEQGAVSDAIEVETLSPRKRLLARVVRHGLVEIVTRAPQVR